MQGKKARRLEISTEVGSARPAQRACYTFWFMSAIAFCGVCHKRKAKRHCPGLRETICSVCCGTEREVSIDCPLDCRYLRESRRYEAQKSHPPAEVPFSEIEVGDHFLRDQEPLIGQIGYRLLRYALDNPRTTDNDLQTALEKLVRTYQTLESGLYYESLPEQGSQIGVFRDLQSALKELREKERHRGNIAPVKDTDVIRALVFLCRLAALRSNQKPRGRAFIDFLKQVFPEATSRTEEPRLILPGR
ncbi:MAG: hypothetical protein HY647_09720 [Acidobacteria bacterium]|nr:hypothetical protein [Acidobacteriota bacterium]